MRCARCGSERIAPLLTAALRKRCAGKAGRSWYVDETHVKVAGQWRYLYRAIDRDGNWNSLFRQVSIHSSVFPSHGNEFSP